MKKGYQLAVLICLAICSMALSAFAAEQVEFTVYVHEGNINGTVLSGVQITGHDGQATVLRAQQTQMDLRSSWD